MSSEQEKIAYMREVVSFDLMMLNYTFMRIVTSHPSTPEEQLDCNAFLESFGVHARNLVDFFSGRPRENCQNARGYVSDFEVPDQRRVEKALARLDRVTLHLNRQEKFDVSDARELYAWIVPVVLRFQEQLAPSYRASLDALGSTEAKGSTS
jgi:hypothetical protein